MNQLNIIFKSAPNPPNARQNRNLT